MCVYVGHILKSVMAVMVKQTRGTRAHSFKWLHYKYINNIPNRIHTSHFYLELFQHSDNLWQQNQLAQTINRLYSACSLVQSPRNVWASQCVNGAVVCLWNSQKASGHVDVAQSGASCSPVYRLQGTSKLNIYIKWPLLQVIPLCLTQTEHFQQENPSETVNVLLCNTKQRSH